MRPSGSAARSACWSSPAWLAIALGLDTRVLAKLSSTQTASLETGIARKLGLGGSEQPDAKIGVGGRLELPVEGQFPSLDKLGPWINSAPLTREQLKGKVVADRLLDLQLHQLHPLDPLRSRLAWELAKRTGWS